MLQHRFLTGFFKPQQWPTRLYEWPVLICKFTEQVYGRTYTQFLFIYLFTQYFKRVTRLAKIAILPCGPLLT